MKSFVKTIFKSLILVIASLATPTLALAQNPPPTVGTITFPAGFKLDAGTLLNNLVGIFIAVAGLIFFFMLLWGGIRYMVAGGDPKNAQAAQAIIKNAVIGLVIVVAAYSITFILGTILGITFLNPNIPGL